MDEGSELEVNWIRIKCRPMDV